MGESLKGQLRLLEKLFDAKLKPIGQGLAEIKGLVAGHCTRIDVLEKDVTKLKVHNGNRQARAELRVKKWHVWAAIIGYFILGGSAIIAALL